jgi:hypothetical protein
MVNRQDNERKHGGVMGSFWIVVAIAIAFVIVTVSYWSDHGGPLTQGSNPAPKNATTGSGSAAR